MGKTHGQRWFAVDDERILRGRPGKILAWIRRRPSVKRQQGSNNVLIDMEVEVMETLRMFQQLMWAILSGFEVCNL